MPTNQVHFPDKVIIWPFLILVIHNLKCNYEIKFWSQIFMFNLNFSLAFGGVSKVNDHLATPLSLCLTQWCTKQCRQRRQKYSLYAVVMHSGVSSSSGHYVCYVKIPARQIPSTEITEFDEDCDSNTEVWGHFDDERVTIFSDHEFSQVLHPINGTMTTATPYLLFYRQAVEEIWRGTSPVFRCFRVPLPQAHW